MLMCSCRDCHPDDLWGAAWLRMEGATGIKITVSRLFVSPGWRHSSAGLSVECSSPTALHFLLLCVYMSYCRGRHSLWCPWEHPKGPQTSALDWWIQWRAGSCTLERPGEISWMSPQGLETSTRHVNCSLKVTE